MPARTPARARLALAVVAAVGGSVLTAPASAGPVAGTVRPTGTPLGSSAAARAAALPAAESAADPEGAPRAGAGRRIVYRSWTGETLTAGRLSGVTVARGAVRLSAPTASSGGYELGRWVSPWVSPGFDVTELVPSWRAATPGASWIQVEVRGRADGRRGSWDTIARWARDDTAYRRASGESQTDDLGRVLYDTWVSGGVAAWQLRVTLLRRPGGRSPSLRAVGAMASRLPSVSDVATSTPGVLGGAALGTVLPVPSYSQMVHEGSYPEYDGGGEAWCSPTSTTMVLGYYDRLPPPRSYRWVRADHPDRVVAHLARMTYDVAFGGTGNWPFNTAYAATRTKRAFVTRLKSLREAERFIAAGIPLVASVTFGSRELSGSPIDATNGHLLVIAGFRANGDVVVNDPAAASRAGVRRTYDRGQFEDAWLRRTPSGSSFRGSGGLVYVIHDDAHPLPAKAASQRNW